MALGPQDICYSYLRKMIQEHHPLMEELHTATRRNDVLHTMSLPHLLPLVVNVVEQQMGYAAPQSNRLAILAEILYNDPQLCADLHERIRKIEEGLEPMQ